MIHCFMSPQLLNVFKLNFFVLCFFSIGFLTAQNNNINNKKKNCFYVKPVVHIGVGKAVSTPFYKGQSMFNSPYVENAIKANVYYKRIGVSYTWNIGLHRHIHYKIENYHSNNRVAGVYHYNEFLDNRSNRLAFNYQILQNKQVCIYSQLGLEWSKTTHEFNRYFEFFDSTGKEVSFPNKINNLPFHQNSYLLNAGLNIQYALFKSMFLLHYTMQYHHPLNVNNYQSDNGLHRISNELGLTLNLSKFIKKIKTP